jgi:ligand-binding sensor domain-containing protein
VAFPKIWISLTLYLLSLHFGTAQENYTLRTFTTKDGLPHNQILSIAQDSTGFIRIATWDGLSRFDGYEFKNYYHNPLDSTTIPYFTVNDLVMSKDNELFITTINYPPVIYNKP